MNRFVLQALSPRWSERARQVCSLNGRALPVNPLFFIIVTNCCCPSSPPPTLQNVLLPHTMSARLTGPAAAAEADIPHMNKKAIAKAVTSPERTAACESLER